jgi:hypothetical protein
VPILRDGEEDYVVDSKTHTIGYVDPSTRIPSYTASYGYVTSFMYFHLRDKRHLLDDGENFDINRAKCAGWIGIGLQCGVLAYSELPKLYEVVLGMTGTLDSLAPSQQDLLNKIETNAAKADDSSNRGFARRTFLPSTFQKKLLNKDRMENLHDPEDDMVGTVVVPGTYQEYFDVVKKEITRELENGRAILVVFADDKTLEKFQSKLIEQPPKLNRFRPAAVLSDKLAENERKKVVSKAIERYRVTLITRSYGRGTDFVCHDEALRKNGGVHIIITFFPEDESENKQINGRTCRQDDPGSARKIIFEDELVTYLPDATEIQFHKQSRYKTWDEYLKALRSQKQKIIVEQILQDNKEIMEKHDLTRTACAATGQKKWDEALSAFGRAVA